MQRTETQQTASHRKAMLSNLAVSVLDKERVETTIFQGKGSTPRRRAAYFLRKKGDLHARSLAARRVNDQAVLRKLFREIGPAFKDRSGGYVRVIKTGMRKGDNTLMAMVELVGIGGADTVRKRRKQKKAEEQGQARTAPQEKNRTAGPEKAAYK